MIWDLGIWGIWGNVTRTKSEIHLYAGNNKVTLHSVPYIVTLQLIISDKP